MNNLSNFGVQELNAKEIEETNGGAVGVAITLGVIAVGIFFWIRSKIREAR